MTADRLSRLQTTLKQTGLDALVLNPGPTLFYLTGLRFHLMERPVLAFFTPGSEPVLVIPELERAKLEQLPYPVKAFQYGEDPAGWPGVFSEAGAALPGEIKKVGVEPTGIRFLELDMLRAAIPYAAPVAADAAVAALRLRKDASEVDRMRLAVAAAQNAFNATLNHIREGMTERELASELTIQLLRAGSDSEFPFTPIIASGPNSANPHAVPTDRKLAAGDLVVIDWGAGVQGYFSDLTRTIAIKKVSQELAFIHDVVNQANAVGRNAARPGITAGKVDDAAREVIEDAGYGEYFTHRTGHGLGMEAHEAPYIFSGNQEILAPGMTFTVEPGIYLPGVGGVRIEDNVVITQSGAESLSNLVRELIVVG